MVEVERIRHVRQTSAYTQEIDVTLPRVLALMDNDPLSPTFGVADRQYWAWKLIDFPNATYQGAVNGLAHLLAANLFTEAISSAAIVQRIESLLHGTRAITRRNGSLEEAFPFENSFCVTALVAFDLLRANDDLASLGLRSLERDLSRTVAPLIGFLKKANETHGFIANHLATAAACLLRWHRLQGDMEAHRRGQKLLAEILAHQSDEGWFPEYGGADPGYETLCLTYLADVVQVDPSDTLFAALRRSVEFLQHFAHPDGSFGGLYGSRNTRIFYPAGIEALSVAIPEARALANFMQQAIARHATVPLSAIDQPNLIPMFNNYCWAARLAATRSDASAEMSGDSCVPALRKRGYRQHFPKAGILVDHAPTRHTIISTHKGGVVYQDDSAGPRLIDLGPVWRDARGRFYTTQTYEPQNSADFEPERDVITVVAQVRRLQKPVPAPWNFIVLRLFAVSLMRIPAIGNFVKRFLARWLITNKGSPVGTNRRTINLGHNLSIDDRSKVGAGLKRVETAGHFSVIHMASQGYWEIQDDAPQSSGNPTTTPHRTEESS